MASQAGGALRPRTSLNTALLAGVLAGVAALGGCSGVPDALNPAEWYRSTVDVFKGDDKAKQATDQSGKPSELKADRGTAPPGADKPFPNLAGVDERARRDNLSGGLSADPERPKYAPPVARQGPAAIAQVQPRPVPVSPSMAAAPPPATPPAVPPPPAMAAAPPPAAAPTPPVTPVPMAAPQEPRRSTERMSADQKEQQTRLSQQLAELRARAAEPSAMPANAAVPSAGGAYATVVVSADGIETADFGLAPPSPSAALPPTTTDTGGALVENRGAMPVPMTAVRVATILFDNGSSVLKAKDKQILGAVGRLHSQRGGVIRVVGHASSRTRNLPPVRHKMANFQISAARADRVARELMRHGVAKNNILIAAVSDADPMYYEFMPSGEAGNRRAEIYLGN